MTYAFKPVNSTKTVRQTLPVDCCLVLVSFSVFKNPSTILKINCISKKIVINNADQEINKHLCLIRDS